VASLTSSKGIRWFGSRRLIAPWISTSSPWRDGYLAMPDNGFGSKANSHSFLLALSRAEKPPTGWRPPGAGVGSVLGKLSAPGSRA
jgi:hypothetical protein